MPATIAASASNATVVAAQRCTLLSLDSVDFRELIGRQPDLGRIIHEEAERRLVSADV